MSIKLVFPVALLALAGCTSTAPQAPPARAPGTDPCDMTTLEHRQSAAREARRADAARWRTTTTKQGVLARQRDRRTAASGDTAAGQHSEAAESAGDCR